MRVYLQIKVRAGSNTSVFMSTAMNPELSIDAVRHCRRFSAREHRIKMTLDRGPKGEKNPHAGQMNDARERRREPADRARVVHILLVSHVSMLADLLCAFHR